MPNLISGKISCAQLLDRTCQNNNLHFQFCQGDSVTALAVDWLTSNLYWSSIKKPDLHVTTRSGDHTAVLLQPSLTVTEASLRPNTFIFQFQSSFFISFVCFP